MILLVALALLVALGFGGAALANALGIRLRWLLLAAPVVVLLLAGLVLLGIGVERSEDAERAETSSGAQQRATTTTEAVAAEPSESAPPPVARPQPTRRSDVVVQAEFEGGLPAPAPVIDGLAGGDAPLLEVRGLPANASGVARQCLPGGRRCAAGIPLRTDERGTAYAVIPLSDAVGDRRCEPRCELRIDVDGVGPTVELRFGAQAGTVPTVDVEPDAARPGDTVVVTVRGLPPGAEVAVTQCAEVVPHVDPCGGRAPRVPLTAGADGTGRVTYRLVAGDVGQPGGPPCERGARCGVTVVDGATVLARTAPVRILGAPGVSYDGTRLLAGLSIAALLAAVALWLMRTTDWHQVGLPSTTDDA